MKRFIVLASAVMLVALLAGGVYRGAAPALSISATTSIVPTTTIKRGDLTLTVTARGEMQGGNSEMLTAPMTGGNEMAITSLRNPGEVVNSGDVIAQFDTTEEGFKLKEAEADLAEAEQQVAQAQAESQAKEEEDRCSLLQAKADLQVSELEARRNELVADIVARQNDLAVSAARDRVSQIEHDLANRKATSQAGIVLQQAALNKAKVKAATARKNIESMTLRAHSSGYVAVQNNTRISCSRVCACRPCRSATPYGQAWLSRRSPICTTGK